MENKFKLYTGTKTVKAMFMGAGEAKGMAQTSPMKL